VQDNLNTVNSDPGQYKTCILRGRLLFAKHPRLPVRNFPHGLSARRLKHNSQGRKEVTCGTSILFRSPLILVVNSVEHLVKQVTTFD
jgi:hypothetical protein